MPGRRPDDASGRRCRITYQWEATSPTAWSSTCSHSATRTVTWVCKGSDGRTASDDAKCGAKPSSTQTQGVYDTCDAAIPNPDMEKTTGWYFSGGASYTTAAARSGTRSILLPGYGAQATTSLTTSIRTNYEVSFYARGASFKLPINEGSYGAVTVLSGTCSSGLCYPGADWTLFKLKFNSALRSDVNFDAGGWNQGAAYIDDLSIRPVP